MAADTQIQTDMSAENPHVTHRRTATGLSTVARLTAWGFAAGSAVHATAWVGMWFGYHWYGPTYPAWRHVAMATVDGSIASIGLRRPTWLLLALPAWIAEQWIVNGFELEGALVTLAWVLLVWERWRRSPDS